MHMTTYVVDYGDRGVRQTLDMMRALVDAALDDLSVISLARQLAVGAGVRRPYMQALAIQGFLKRTWRFVDDPLDRDVMISPVESVAQFARNGYIVGDCDEAATLGAALGRAIGLNAEFWVLGFGSDDPAENDRLAHVFAVLLTDDGRQVSLDVTRPSGPLPNPTRTLAVDV